MATTLHDRVTALERASIRHDKEIAAIRKLVHTGMKMLVRLEANQDKLQASVTELTNSLKRWPNGHSKRKLDLQ